MAVTDTRQSILEVAQRLMADKGWGSVGINQVLGAAGVPKGSFYHWFSSKDAFGEAMIQNYFVGYLAEMDGILAGASPAGDRLMDYWRNWRATQSLGDCQGRCLAVKLGAEVADLSESMRTALKAGTDSIVDRVRRTVEAGVADGSIPVGLDAAATARTLYDLWLGASVMAKIQRDAAPLDNALAVTERILGVPTAG